MDWASHHFDSRISYAKVSRWTLDTRPRNRYLGMNRSVNCRKSPLNRCKDKKAKGENCQRGGYLATRQLGDLATAPQLGNFVTWRCDLHNFQP